MPRPRPFRAARRWCGVLVLVMAPGTMGTGDPGFATGATHAAQASAGGPTAQRAETTVWERVYSEQQATRGQHVYQQRCLKCHRADLSGDGALQGEGSEVVPTLVGLSFDLRWYELTVADIFLTISRAMPWDAPGTVSPQDNIDVVSYLLKMNAIPSGETELPTETEQLDHIRVTAKPPSDR